MNYGRIIVRMTVVLSCILLASQNSYCDGQITSDLYPKGQIGEPFEYHITASNHPTSFDALGLPKGLTINAATGLIAGVPTINGGVYVQLVAHGPNGDATATGIFGVYLPIPAAEPFSGSMYSAVSCIIADPTRSRIYVGNAHDELVIIDSDTGSVLTTLSNTGVVTDLHISQDGQTLWFLNSYYYNPLRRVDLNTLGSFVVVATSQPFDQIREGLGNRLYGAARNGDVVQLDATTGSIQTRFVPSEGFGYHQSLESRT